MNDKIYDYIIFNQKSFFIYNIYRINKQINMNKIY
jgi:hypothetical protein